MLDFAFLQKKKVFLDLATEAHSLLRGDENKEIPGVAEKVTNNDKWKITEISILDEEGATLMGRPIGKYDTIDVAVFPEETEVMEKTATSVANLLKPLLPTHTEGPILLCGLGNPHITADALGPSVIHQSMATRHYFMYMREHVEEGFSDVALCTPDVMGNTGLEAAEIIKSVAEEIKAKAVIIVDALAAASVKRVGTSFQISNTGITPGAGLGNQRLAINEATLGIPVIAIGVPTVVHLSTLFSEAIGTLIDEGLYSGNVNSSKEELTNTILHHVLESRDDQFAVTPKDIDHEIAIIADTLTLALHLTLHSKISLSNYQEYLNLNGALI